MGIKFIRINGRANRIIFGGFDSLSHYDKYKLKRDFYANFDIRAFVYWFKDAYTLLLFIFYSFTEIRTQVLCMISFILYHLYQPHSHKERNNNFILHIQSFLK